MSPCSPLIGQLTNSLASHWSASDWLTSRQSEEEVRGRVCNFMQFLVVKLKCWNLCIRISYIDIQRLLSLSYKECFDFIINLPKRNRRQYGTFVVKYKFGSNYPVAGFLRPDVDNNVSATGGWAARGALCASPPTRVIPCALRGPGWEGRGKTKVGRNIWTFLSAKGSIYKSKLMFA